MTLKAAPQRYVIPAIQSRHTVNGVFHEGGGKVEAIGHRISDHFQWDVLPVMW